MMLAEGEDPTVVRFNPPEVASLTFVDPGFVDSVDDVYLGGVLRLAFRKMSEAATKEGRTLDPDRVVALQLRAGTVPA